MSITIKKFSFIFGREVKRHPMRSRFTAWICICNESTWVPRRQESWNTMFLKEILKKKVNLRFRCFRKFVAGKHPTEFLASDRIMLQCIAYFVSIHLTKVILDDVSAGINVNDVFKFSVTHHTHGSCGCSGELDVNSEISFLHDIKMREDPHMSKKVNKVRILAAYERNGVTNSRVWRRYTDNKENNRKSLRIGIDVSFIPH